ncbi:hypothetical protein BC829DRAFT_420704 [Chytridium lagenaria]|nr:hypothetical protein BC829DRAFT_420704 [Chytridium lagenaria]
MAFAASVDCPILADALPTLNINRTLCCSLNPNAPIYCDNGRVVKVVFKDCSINGPLSPLLANLTGLKELWVPETSFTPESFNMAQIKVKFQTAESQAPYLPGYQLGKTWYFCRLSGEIPVLQNTTDLYALIAILPEMFSLNFNDNNLYGPIPAELGRSNRIDGNCFDEKMY